MKGSTTKRETETQAEDLRGSIEELSSIFAIANFPSGVDNTDGTTIYEGMTDLNIGPSRPPKVLTYHLIIKLIVNMSL